MFPALLLPAMATQFARPTLSLRTIRKLDKTTHTPTQTHAHTPSLRASEEQYDRESGGLTSGEAERPREVSRHLVLLYPVKILCKNKRKQDF